MSNPLAVATVANSKEGQKAISNTTNAIKTLFIVGGAVWSLRFAWTKYKEWRSEKYANENAGNPNLTAAAIIYNSFSRFEPTGFLSYILPSFDISTNEAALYNIAAQVNNVQSVAEAYSILFDRNLFFDVQDGLNTEELNTFWNIINAPDNNVDTDTFYPIGSKLYAANNNLLINKAVFENGKWKGTNELYGQYGINDLVGEVVAHGKVSNEDEGDPNLVGQNYYIIKECGLFKIWCNDGVVVQSQIRNSPL